MENINNTAKNTTVSSTTFVNLTPHEVKLMTQDGQITSIPASGQVARISTSFEVDSILNGVIVGHTDYSGVTGLPEQVEGTIYIVSLVLLKALPDRTDLVAPNELVRDEKGLVLYAKSLTR